ncbi:MAG TPA: hypothetical protein PLZ77_06660 [Lachnospiraceae bacterium]|nr:hypothetical protein [Lachnospiraceae bacterium]HPF29769.1 hypothetical protein [Lachnospiraceae bacterium]
MIGRISPISTRMTVDTAPRINQSLDVQTGIDDPIARTGKPAECQTCKNRKYVDGSDEMVSFKSPTNISPEQSATKVRAHEQEHVNNAFSKAAGMNGGKVLQASVALKAAICPECGRSYVAGGTTTTKIAYQKNSPYSQNQKSFQKDACVGSNFDKAI